MVIDKYSIDKNQRYNFLLPNTYIDQTSSISVLSHIDSNCVIGRHTSINDNSTISGTIVGPDCIIGKNVNIKNSIIEGGVTICDGCQITNAII